MNKTVSVIITTYKRPMQTLCRAIDSAYAQTYKDIEVIVVNDYPEYKELITSTLNKYRTIKILHNVKNSGACFSRNQGISASIGEYIAFLDDDDTWAVNKIERQLAELTGNIGMVYCSGVNIYDNGKISKMPFIKDCTHDKIALMLQGNCMGGCSFPLIKRRVLEEVGGFDETLKSSQDYDLWLRIIQMTNIKFLPDELVNYYISADSITSSVDKRLQGYSVVLKKHNELFKRYPKSAVMFLNNMVGTCVAEKCYKRALSVFMQSFQFFPHNLIIAGKWIEILANKVKKH